MKIIFTDIDGVLNSTKGEEPYESDMEVEKLLLLKQLIDETNADGIVITSDRRTSYVDMLAKLAAFAHFDIPILGQTRTESEVDLNDNRGKQILDYLADTKREIENIVIFDDMDDGISELLFEQFIQTDRRNGLTLENKEQAKNILNQQ